VIVDFSVEKVEKVMKDENDVEAKNMTPNILISNFSLIHTLNSSAIYLLILLNTKWHLMK